MVKGQGYVGHPPTSQPPTCISRYRNLPSNFVKRVSEIFLPLADGPLSLSHTIVKDKANHAVILDKATSDKLYKDVQSYRLITVATLVDRLKINGSLARKALTDLEEKGQIKKVVGHSKLSIYSEFTEWWRWWYFAETDGVLARAVTAAE